MGVKGKVDFISIIIVTRNAKSITKQCVDSIFKHTDLNFEILFIDNGSSDGTLEFLKGVPKSIVIQNKENSGFAKACNQGIANAKGNYIVLLNNDTVVTKGWLSGLLYWLKIDEGIGIVGPRSTNVGGNQNVGSVNYKSMTEMEEFAANFSRVNYHTGAMEGTLSGFCMMFHKNLTYQIGGLDERFFPGTFEDDDFCIRTQIFGKKLWRANDVFIHHVGHQTFNKNEENYNQIFSENQMKFNAKWNPSKFKNRTELIQFEQPFNCSRHYFPINRMKYKITRDK
ncbi:glycosyltransferase family 2 protein [Neobacillus mesonae]|uniref:glycosyltransferase family 2 protein n=1 Tax=Neobacillus mesonae TaxID=1193713 RepID=UPI00203B1E2C|nr:glycosyltransferase family 2 protein [Neobacillus mesonae]MCM3568567.1 glycosyltransferase family 2 protein [Neobacillus mesonae]